MGFTISPGSSVRGFILIQKITETCIKKEGRFRYFGEPWSFTIEFTENEEKKNYHPKFITTGFPIKSVKKVGFIIDEIGPFKIGIEFLIFEIVTNGRISPFESIREATLITTHKFYQICNVIFPLFTKKEDFNFKKKIYNRNSTFLNNIYLSNSMGEKSIYKFSYNLFKLNSYQIFERISLDLINLDLPKSLYEEINRIGFKKIGSLIERIAFEHKIFKEPIKKKVKNALNCIGLRFL